MHLSPHGDLELTKKATTRDSATKDTATYIPDMEKPSLIPTAEMSHRQASREYSPCNPSQSNDSRMDSNSTTQHPDDLALMYDPVTGQQLFFNTYAQQWEAVNINSHQYTHLYSQNAGNYHPRQEFFPHSKSEQPPPPIPARPVPPGAPTMAYTPRPAPPVYPPRSGYYYPGLPMHAPPPSGYYPAALSYPPRFSHPPPNYHPQRLGAHQPPEIRAGPPPLQSVRQGHDSQGGHHNDPALQDGTQLGDMTDNVAF